MDRGDDYAGAGFEYLRRAEGHAGVGGQLTPVLERY